MFSAASTIQVATYSFGRPIGTSTPQSATYRLASLDNQGIDITGSVTRNPIMQAPPRYQASDFPKVDRTLKGDRLVTLAPSRRPRRPTPRPRLEDPSTSNASVIGAKTADAAPSASRRSIRNLQAALSAPPLPQYDVSMSLEAQPLDDLKAAPDRRSRSSRRRRATVSRSRPRACFSEAPRSAVRRKASSAGSPARSR